MKKYLIKSLMVLSASTRLGSHRVGLQKSSGWTHAKALLAGLFSLLLMTQCNYKKDDETNETDLTGVKTKFSAETINYFYETAFYGGGTEKLDSISRWQTDIFVYLDGTIWKNDSLYITSVIDDLNQLNLPVKIALTDDRLQANLHMYFGNYDYLSAKLEITDYDPFTAKANISGSGSKKLGIIGIANQSPGYNNRSKADSAILRKKIITYTIANCMGIVGKSGSHYKSVFFGGDNNVVRLSTIDKQILKLLYEPAFSATISRKQFEVNFKDILYHLDSKEKIIKYVHENKIPVSHLEFIRDHCFSDTMLLKYPKNVFVKLDGNYKEQDLEFCKKAVKLINTASDYLCLELEQTDTWHDLPSIRILYNDSNNNSSGEVGIYQNNGGMMYPFRIEGKLKLTFDRNKTAQKNINETVFKSLYTIIGFPRKKLTPVDIDKHNNPHFQPHYKEILSLVYNPIFPSGFSLRDMNEVIMSVKTTPKLQ